MLLYFLISPFFRLEITGYKLVHQFSLPALTVLHIWLLLRLSRISCFPARLLSLRNSFLPGCRQDSASCQESQQEAESGGQSWQEALCHQQQSQQEAGDHGQSRWKPSLMDSVSRNTGGYKLVWAGQSYELDTSMWCYMVLACDTLSCRDDQSSQKKKKK